ncbi:MAG: ABC transporter permease subunit, partial [Planctomycetes bacterium]|nr:ABC transporter permease subunit [Planctomycetota bacterium]
AVCGGVGGWAVSLFAVPFLTNGLLGDGRRSCTIEMLMTAPVADWEVVLGKYIGSAIYVLCLIAPAFLQILVVRVYGVPEWGPVISACIGLVLLVLFLISIGLFFSSISKHVLVAVMLSFVAFMLLLFLGLLVPESPPAIETGNVFSNIVHYLFAVLRYASLEHYYNFFEGVVNTRDVVFFVSGTAFFLFLSTLAVESRKWK